MGKKNTIEKYLNMDNEYLKYYCYSNSIKVMNWAENKTVGVITDTTLVYNMGNRAIQDLIHKLRKIDEDLNLNRVFNTPSVASKIIHELYTGKLYYYDEDHKKILTMEQLKAKLLKE